MNNSFTITQTTWQEAQQALSMLRTTVFMEEQQVSAEDEWDGKDECAIHFLVSDAKGHAIGCARILHETHHTTPCFHIGRVAILKTYRKQGIGHQLMQTTIAWCQKQHPDYSIYLHAQTERITFYERLNFVAQGEIFMDAGIPHIEMWYKTT